MNRKATANKILVLGVDGFDPSFAKRVMDQGKMPALKEIVDRGSCREDMAMIGGQPTITPPMWTTLATGAYSYTHGITCFNRQSPDKLSAWRYNIDSRYCKAEQLWNVFVEAGKKTLVFHWPGSSWPPTSDSENLFVVDGSGPAGVAMGFAQTEEPLLIEADASYTEVKAVEREESLASESCVVKGLNSEDDAKSGTSIKDNLTSGTADTEVLVLDVRTEGSNAALLQEPQKYISPIKDATGWENAPQGAKEFTMLLSNGLIQRPCLILKNENGEYDTVEIYKNKKASEPIAVLPKLVLVKDIVDHGYDYDDKLCNVSRYMKLLDIKPDGSYVFIWISAAMDIDVDVCYSPKSLYKEIVDAAGYTPPASYPSSHNQLLVEEAMIDSWNGVKDWQIKAMNTIIDNHDIEVVFSHFHNVDIIGHRLVRYFYDRHDGDCVLSSDMYVKFMEKVYMQTDQYLAGFLPRLNEGWTILITSDHGLGCGLYHPPLLSDATGCTVGVMKELGYTVLKKDADGNEIREIDWEKTTAVATRANHIYINLIGRTQYGCVDPKDKYELEERILTDLSAYKDPVSGKRIVSVALRNRDAVLLGMGGPEAGDIIYFYDEHNMTDHGETLSTARGVEGTSMNSFFVAAGPGIKEGFKTDRVIRQVDFAPTIAVLGGVRMPKQCEGAPVYQVLTEEF